VWFFFCMAFDCANILACISISILFF